MPCTPIQFGDGGRGFACGPKSRRRCACGNPEKFLCDWKTPEGRKPTCDKPLCEKCTHKPEPDKDLCPTHAAEWKALKARMGRR